VAATASPSAVTACSTTGQVLGVLTAQVDPCAATIGLQPGGLDHNIIRNIGLCGIGPIAFFDLLNDSEVVSIAKLTICSNTILNTLQSELTAFSRDSSLFGYGAICLPDVENLTIRDDTITNFGATPGLNVCGIFVMHGELVNISRNQVLEARDWTSDATNSQAANTVRGGVWVPLVTRPSYLATAGHFASFTFEFGLPALRVEHNIVRVPLGITFAPSASVPSLSSTTTSPVAAQ